MSLAWFDTSLILEKWFDEEMDAASSTLGEFPLESDPRRLPERPKRRGGPWSEPLAAFVPLGAAPLEEQPTRLSRARIRVVPSPEQPLGSLTVALGAQPLDEPPRLASRGRLRLLPAGETPLAAFAQALGAQPLDEAPARSSSRHAVPPRLQENPLAGFLGIVPEHQPAAVLRPAAFRRPGAHEVPLAGFLGTVPDPGGPALLRRRPSLIVRPDDGTPPSLFLFSAWVPENAPAIVRRQTGVHLLFDSLVPAALAGVQLGAFVEGPGIARRRPPAVPSLARDAFPFAAVAAPPALGAWFEDATRVRLAARSRPRPGQPPDAIRELIRPWLSDEAPQRVARARVRVPPAGETPLAGLISSWFGGLEQGPALVRRRSTAKLLADAGPALPGLATTWFEDAPRARALLRRTIALPLGEAPLQALQQPLLAWFEESGSLVLPLRALRLVVPAADFVPLLLVVVVTYIELPSDRKAYLRAHARRGVLLQASTQRAMLLPMTRRSVLG